MGLQHCLHGCVVVIDSWVHMRINNNETRSEAPSELFLTLLDWSSLIKPRLTSSAQIPSSLVSKKALLNLALHFRNLWYSLVFFPDMAVVSSKVLDTSKARSLRLRTIGGIPVEVPRLFQGHSSLELSDRDHVRCFYTCVHTQLISLGFDAQSIVCSL